MLAAVGLAQTVRVVPTDRHAPVTGTVRNGHGDRITETVRIGHGDRITTKA